MSASSGWPVWPADRGSRRFLPRLSGSRGAARQGLARWGARSARRPPWAGPCARAGGTGTSRGRTTPCISCRSRSASSSTGFGTAYAATPRASWRRSAPPPSGGWATGRTARPAARRCGQPPRSWRSRCRAGSWQGPCGQRPGYRATACAPTPRAPTAARRTRTRPTSCGIARNGTAPGRRGSPGCATRRGLSPAWARRTAGLPACARRGFSPSVWRRGSIGTSSMSFCTACTACIWRSSRPGWRPARGISRATVTPSSRSGRVRGPAIPSPGTPSLAPSQGMPSATNRGYNRGCHLTGGGPRSSSSTWSSGPGPGAGGGLLGRAGPGLRGLRGAGAPGLTGPPAARHSPAAGRAGASPA